MQMIFERRVGFCVLRRLVFKARFRFNSLILQRRKTRPKELNLLIHKMDEMPSRVHAFQHLPPLLMPILHQVYELIKFISLSHYPHINSFFLPLPPLEDYHSYLFSGRH